MPFRQIDPERGGQIPNSIRDTPQQQLEASLPRIRQIEGLTEAAIVGQQQLIASQTQAQLAPIRAAQSAAGAQPGQIREMLGITLRELGLSREQLGLRGEGVERQQLEGLRDIGIAREEGIRAAIQNALQRGIFRSGIREANVARVEARAAEAEEDLLTAMDFARRGLDIEGRGINLAEERARAQARHAIQNVRGQLAGLAAQAQALRSAAEFQRQQVARSLLEQAQSAIESEGLIPLEIDRQIQAFRQTSAPDFLKQFDQDLLGLLEMFRQQQGPRQTGGGMFVGVQ